MMTDTRQTSVILNIASTGQIADLKALVDNDGCIDSTDIIGKSALWLAIERRNGVAIDTLLKAGADVNKTYKSRQTPLMLAVDKGCTEYVRIILDAGAEVDSVDSFGTSALMIACQRGNLEILKILVSAGANLHIRDIRGKTGLLIALENNSCDCLKYLIEAGAKINLNDFRGNSPLKTAICKQCLTCVRTLVLAGAAVNEVNGHGQTLMMIAVQWHSNVLHVLINSGASLDAVDNRLKTATMYAAAEGQESSLIQLIQAGANVNMKDESGQTALMMAAEAGNAECVKYLIEAGARQELRDVKTKTALMLAAIEKRYDCLKVLLAKAENYKDMQCHSGKTALIYAAENLRTIYMPAYLISKPIHKFLHAVGTIHPKDPLDTPMKCLQSLLKAGANPGICDKKGMSPLMHAARVDILAESFQDLVDAGADIGMTDNSGLTALGHAAACENVEFVKKLVESGASVNITNHNGETPLLILAKKIDSEDACDCIAYLLDHHADVNARDPNGMTPLMWAAKSSTDTNAMKLFIKHGADVNMTDGSGLSALHHTMYQHNERLNNARFLLDSNADPNIKTAQGKSVVSMAVRDRKRDFLDLLLKYNADLCIDWEDFCHLVRSGDKRMLQYVVSLGLFPSQAVPPGSKLKDRSSVLTTLLNLRSLAIIKFLLASGYLGKSDVMHRQINSPQIPRITWTHRTHICLTDAKVVTFCNNVCSQPWPLVKLSFIAVSSLMGPSPGRKQRVRTSGLPDRLQRMLLFEEPVSKLCKNLWDCIPFCFNPDDYEKLPKPRPLLFYWPYGRELAPCHCDECCPANCCEICRQHGFKFL